MPIGEMAIPWGNILNNFILKATLTPVATAPTSTVEQNFTVNGLAIGDQISDISLQAAFSNTVLSIANARVSAVNTLTLAITNPTAGSLTYPTGSYYIEVNRPDLQNLPSVIQ
jgi:hypothetical protein